MGAGPGGLRLVTALAALGRSARIDTEDERNLAAERPSNLWNNDSRKERTMYADDILMDIEFERGFDFENEVISGYRERYGEYRLGCVDNDPQMDRFDEMVDLARSLR